ncbi:hypothetical protein ACX80E_00810 [Arthrobacter sp. TMN-49]
MFETVDQAAAVRATAFIRLSRWRHRPERLVRYDAYWANGRVEFDVSLSKMLFRGSPADFDPVAKSVHAHCPEAGTGRWVNEFGCVVEGPTQTDPNPPGKGRSKWHRYGVSRYESIMRATYAWRLGGGIASLGLGILLLNAPISDGPAGLVGAVFSLTGVASLACLIPGKNRPW